MTLFGPEHPDTLVSMTALASAYCEAGRGNEAVPLIEEAVKLFKEKQGPEHPNTVSAMANLAYAYWTLGKLDRSIPLFEEAHQAPEKKSVVKLIAKPLQQWVIWARTMLMPVGWTRR